MRICPAKPDDLAKLLAFRQEAAAWLSRLGTDQWQRPYPADKLLAASEAGEVFMVRDGDATAATITLTPVAEEGLWTADELREASLFINKLTVARTHAGQNLGGRLLDWAGDRGHRAGAEWLRLDDEHRFAGVLPASRLPACPDRSPGGRRERWTEGVRMAGSAGYTTRTARIRR